MAYFIFLGKEVEPPGLIEITPAQSETCIWCNPDEATLRRRLAKAISNKKYRIKHRGPPKRNAPVPFLLNHMNMIPRDIPQELREKLLRHNVKLHNRCTCNPWQENLLERKRIAKANANWRYRLKKKMAKLGENANSNHSVELINASDSGGEGGVKLKFEDGHEASLTLETKEVGKDMSSKGTEEPINLENPCGESGAQLTFQIDPDLVMEQKESMESAETERIVSAAAELLEKEREKRERWKERHRERLRKAYWAKKAARKKLAQMQAQSLDHNNLDEAATHIKMEPVEGLIEIAPVVPQSCNQCNPDEATLRRKIAKAISNKKYKEKIRQMKNASNPGREKALPGLQPKSKIVIPQNIPEDLWEKLVNSGVTLKTTCNCNESEETKAQRFKRAKAVYNQRYRKRRIQSLSSGTEALKGEVLKCEEGPGNSDEGEKNGAQVKFEIEQDPNIAPLIHNESAESFEPDLVPGPVIFDLQDLHSKETGETEASEKQDGLIKSDQECTEETSTEHGEEIPPQITDQNISGEASGHRKPSRAVYARNRRKASRAVGKNINEYWVDIETLHKRYQENVDRYNQMKDAEMSESPTEFPPPPEPKVIPDDIPQAERKKLLMFEYNRQTGYKERLIYKQIKDANIIEMPHSRGKGSHKEPTEARRILSYENETEEEKAIRRKLAKAESNQRYRAKRKAILAQGKKMLGEHLN